MKEWSLTDHFGHCIVVLFGEQKDVKRLEVQMSSRR